MNNNIVWTHVYYLNYIYNEILPIISCIINIVYIYIYIYIYKFYIYIYV